MRATFLLSFLIVLFFISSCDTKVDLIDEGLETAVVYGFIDPTVDTQFVKITKTFVTEGSAVEGAMDPELSEYKNLEAYVIAYDGSDSVDSYLLMEKTVTDKDSGAFYYPVQTVYYFTDQVNFDYSYELAFNGSGNEVRSTSEVVGEFNDNNTINSDIVNLVALFDVTGSNYSNKKIEFPSSINAKRYEFTYRFHYREVYTDGTEKEKHMDFSDPAWIVLNSSVSEQIQFFIKGEEFYQAVAGRIISQNNEENIEKRVIGTITYNFEYAGDDLNTFIELSEPSTSINVEQNPYTNITNGIGVWSSRGRNVFENKTFSISSIKEMALGQFTGDLRFCSEDPAHNGTGWGCN